jgi:hypothetical protein
LWFSGFLMLDQGVGRRWRRMRTHRGAWSVVKHKTGLLSTSSTSETDANPIREFPSTAFSCSAGIAFSRPGRVLFESTARKVGQCWPPLRRPPARLGIDRPSTVLRLAEAVPIIGMVPVKSSFLAAAIVARQSRDPRLPARRGSVARPMLAARHSAVLASSARSRPRHG